MKVREDIRPVTYLKSRTADLLAQVNETKRPVIITQNGEARGVLQDTESYESMKAAIAMLNLLVQGEEDIRKGRVRSQDEVFGRLETKLKSKRQRRQGIRRPACNPVEGIHVENDAGARTHRP